MFNHAITGKSLIALPVKQNFQLVVSIWSNYKEFTETEKYIAMSRARSLLAFVELASE